MGVTGLARDESIEIAADGVGGRAAEDRFRRLVGARRTSPRRAVCASAAREAVVGAAGEHLGPLGLAVAVDEDDEGRRRLPGAPDRRATGRSRRQRQRAEDDIAGSVRQAVAAFGDGGGAVEHEPIHGRAQAGGEEIGVGVGIDQQQSHAACLEQPRGGIGPRPPPPRGGVVSRAECVRRSGSTTYRASGAPGSGRGFRRGCGARSTPPRSPPCTWNMLPISSAPGKGKLR